MMNKENVDDKATQDGPGLTRLRLLVIVVMNILLGTLVIVMFTRITTANDMLDKPVDIQISSNEAVSCIPSINEETEESLVNCDWGNVKASSEDIKTYKSLREVTIDGQQCVGFAHYKKGYTPGYSCRS